MSDESKTEKRNSVPLEKEATTNVDALHAYAVGEAARQSGRTGDAFAAYRQAVALDPKFAQAQMRLSWLYDLEKAEVASASAAEIARDAAAKASTFRSPIRTRNYGTWE